MHVENVGKRQPEDFWSGVSDWKQHKIGCILVSISLLEQLGVVSSDVWKERPCKKADF